jgi:aminomethyltransferase
MAASRPDTLRLEASLPLYGTDMDRTTTPLDRARVGGEARKGRVHRSGRARRQRETGLARRLVGLAMDDAGIPRHGQRVLAGDDEVGVVTSGTKSPTLGSFVGMAYVATAHAATGTPLAVDIRGRRHTAHVVERPFYRRAG